MVTLPTLLHASGAMEASAGLAMQSRAAVGVGAGPGVGRRGRAVIRVGKRPTAASLRVGGPAGPAAAKPLAPLYCLKASRGDSSVFFFFFFFLTPLQRAIPGLCSCEHGVVRVNFGAILSGIFFSSSGCGSLWYGIQCGYMGSSW